MDKQENIRYITPPNYGQESPQSDSSNKETPQSIATYDECRWKAIEFPAGTRTKNDDIDD